MPTVPPWAAQDSARHSLGEDTVRQMVERRGPVSLTSLRHTRACVLLQAVCAGKLTELASGCPAQLPLL